MMKKVDVGQLKSNESDVEMLKLPENFGLFDLFEFMHVSKILPLEVSGHSFSVVRLSKDPNIWQFFDLLTKDEVAYFQKLVNSSASDMSGKQGSRMVSYLKKRGDEVVARVEERLETLSNCAAARLEQLQLSVHRPGSQMRLHLDVFDRNSPDDAVHLERAGQKLKTILIYLADQQEGLVGGSTYFPAVNLEIKPLVGSGIIWDNVNSEGEVDERSIHESQPFSGGMRATLVTWVRERGLF